MLVAALLVTSAASATVLPEVIKENTTLTPANNPYTGATTIESGVTVTVEPGIRFNITRMTVKGTLKAEGTAEKPIVFTGAKEEKAQEWCRIGFEPGSGASVIDHAEVKYAGGCGDGGIVIHGSSPTIKNSIIEHNDSFGIKVPEGGSPEIANNRFANPNYNIYYKAKETQTGEVNIHGNEVEGGEAGIDVEISSTGEVFGKSLGSNTVVNTTGTAFFYEGADIPGDITGNTLSGNKENIIKVKGTVSHSETWKNGGTPVKFTSAVTVASGATLTIAEGVLIEDPDVTVKGTLKVEGTAKEPVALVGAEGKGSNEWCSIAFEPGSGASVIEHAELKNAGNCGKGVIAINASSPTIKNSTFAQDSFYAIKAKEGGSPEIANNVVTEGGSGISYKAASKQTGEVNIHGNLIQGGGLGGIVVEITSTGTVTAKRLAPTSSPARPKRPSSTKAPTSRATSPETRSSATLKT